MNSIRDLLNQRKIHDYNVTKLVNEEELYVELDKIDAIEHEILITDLINFCNTGKFDLPENFI